MIGLEPDLLNVLSKGSQGYLISQFAVGGILIEIVELSKTLGYEEQGRNEQAHDYEFRDEREVFPGILDFPVDMGILIGFHPISPLFPCSSH
jgi:hypothetical protein